MKENIGKNIKILRANCCMSQEKLAYELGYDGPETICRWENGSRAVNVEALNKIAKLFNVTVDEIINSEFNLNPKCIDRFNKIPQRKLNEMIYNLEFPICELDVLEAVSQMDELAYNEDDLDQEEMLIKCVSDFSKAYALDINRKKIASSKFDDQIEKLYQEAFRNGEGIYEAGINLARFWIIKDIENQKNGLQESYSGNVIELLWRLHDIIPNSLKTDIVDFYKALILVFGLYAGTCGRNETEKVNMVKGLMDSGYEEMAILARQYKNTYAIDFLGTITSKVADDVKEKLKTMSLDEYLGTDYNNLSDEEKELIAIFDETDEWHKNFIF